MTPRVARTGIIHASKSFPKQFHRILAKPEPNGSRGIQIDAPRKKIPYAIPLPAEFILDRPSLNINK